MKKKTGMAKRILALTGAVLLAVMYLLTLLFALLDKPWAADWLRASIALTVFVPVLLYAFQLIGRVLKKEDNIPGQQEKEKKAE